MEWYAYTFTKLCIRLNVFMQTEDATYRLGFIHTSTREPSSAPSTEQPLISPLLARLAATENYDKYSPSDLAAILKEAKDKATDDAGVNIQDGPGMININGQLTGVTNEGVDPAEFERTRLAGNAVAQAIGLKPGEKGLIVNGRVSFVHYLVGFVADCVFHHLGYRSSGRL